MTNSAEDEDRAEDEPGQREPEADRCEERPRRGTRHVEASRRLERPAGDGLARRQGWSVGTVARLEVVVFTPGSEVPAEQADDADRGAEREEAEGQERAGQADRQREPHEEQADRADERPDGWPGHVHVSGHPAARRACGDARSIQRRVALPVPGQARDRGEDEPEQRQGDVLDEVRPDRDDDRGDQLQEERPELVQVHRAAGPRSARLGSATITGRSRRARRRRYRTPARGRTR